MVCLSTHMRRLVSIEYDRVTIEAGMQLEALVALLRGMSRQLEASLPTIKSMTIAGAMATGCHGSAASLGPLSSAVLALQLVLAHGELLSCSKTENAEVFRAALCSLGALGIVVSVTVKTRPLTFVAERLVWSTEVPQLRAVAEQSMYAKMYGFGNSGITVTLLGQPSLCSEPPEASHWSDDMLRQARGLLRRTEGLLFALIFLLLPLAWCWRLQALWTRHVASSSGAAVTIVEEPTSPVLLVPQHTSEFAVPLSRADSLWGHLRQLISERPELPMHFVEIRFVAGDAESLISPTAHCGAERCFVYFGLVVFQPFGRAPQHMAELLALFGRLCVGEADGRPHYAKNHSLKAADFGIIFGDNWRQFCNVRKRVDPSGMFLNSHLRSILEET